MSVSFENTATNRGVVTFNQLWIKRLTRLKRI